MQYKIEHLTKKHNRKLFDCGEKELDEFLKRFARQNDEKGLGRTYVAVIEDEPQVYGFYTISSGSIQFDNLPEKKKLPRYPIPVAHLGRLAVDEEAGGHGLGKALLADALQRIVNTSDALGIYAVEVYAKTEEARQFYLKFGFTELLDDKLHLYISVETVKKANG